MEKRAARENGAARALFGFDCFGDRIRNSWQTPLLLELRTAVLSAQLPEQFFHIVSLCIVGVDLQHSFQVLPGEDGLAVFLVGQT